MCLYGALHFIPFNLIWTWPFDPTPGPEAVCKDIICAWVVLYAPFPLIWYATWLLSEQKWCDLLTPPQGPRVCVRREYVLASVLCYISFKFICNITSFRKQSFDLLTPSQGLRVCMDRICACMVLYAPFNLICNMTTFRKNVLTFRTHPMGVSTGKIFATILLHASFPLIWYATWP